MGVKVPNLQDSKNTAVELAIAALDGNVSPLDMDMSGIDPDPTSLDLTLPDKLDNRHAAEMGGGSGWGPTAVPATGKMPRRCAPEFAQ